MVEAEAAEAKADVAESLAAIGAAKPCAEAGPILEDGQLHLATSGVSDWGWAALVLRWILTL